MPSSPPTGRRGTSRNPGRSLFLLPLVVQQYPPGGAVHIFILPRTQAPYESAEPQKTEDKRQGNKIQKHVHRYTRPRSLKAFRMTASDDPDMATAATSGVTNPAIASGMATIL